MKGETYHQLSSSEIESAREEYQRTTNKIFNRLIVSGAIAGVSLAGYTFNELHNSRTSAKNLNEVPAVRSYQRLNSQIDKLNDISSKIEGLGQDKEDIFYMAPQGIIIPLAEVIRDEQRDLTNKLHALTRDERSMNAINDYNSINPSLNQRIMIAFGTGAVMWGSFVAYLFRQDKRAKQKIAEVIGSGTGFKVY